MRLLPVLAATIIATPFANAQQPAAPAQPAQQAQRPAVPRAAPSTRASVAVLIDRRQIEGGWNQSATAGPSRIEIEWGQPHLRGRNVIGMPGVVPWDSVWRTGANVATHLTTDVDLTIGNSFIPRGVYSLFTLPTRNGWKLIVNRQNRQWGTEYDPAQDVARIDLRQRSLPEPLESLTFWLVPTAENAQSTTFPRGVLKLAWGSTELSADWRVGR